MNPDEPTVGDNADRMALNRLGGSLDKALVEPFIADDKISVDARKRLIEEWGSADQTYHDT